MQIAAQAADMAMQCLTILIDIYQLQLDNAFQTQTQMPAIPVVWPALSLNKLLLVLHVIMDMLFK